MFNTCEDGGGILPLSAFSSIHEFSVNTVDTDTPIVMYLGTKDHPNGKPTLPMYWTPEDIEFAIQYIESHPEEFGIVRNLGTDLLISIPENYDFNATNS